MRPATPSAAYETLKLGIVTILGASKALPRRILICVLLTFCGPAYPTSSSAKPVSFLKRCASYLTSKSQPQSKAVVETPAWWREILEDESFISQPINRQNLINKYSAPKAVFQYANYLKDIAEARARHSKELSNIANEDLFALMLYQGPSSHRLNPALRQKDFQKLVDDRDELACLVSGMRKLPKYNGSTFRRMTVSREIYEAKYRPGYVFTEDAFTSTSLHDWRTMAERVLPSFSKEGEVKIIAEYVGTNGRNLSLLEIQDWVDEREVVFLPGTFRTLSEEFVRLKTGFEYIFIRIQSLPEPQGPRKKIDFTAVPD